MKLKQYLTLANDGKGMSIRELAKKIGVHECYLGMIKRELQKPSKFLAKEIERATDGNVKAHELLNPETADDLCVFLNRKTG